MKDTLIISYENGGYGTYLEWVLNILMTSDTIQSPFTELGNSHRSKLGHHLLDIDGFNRYIDSSDLYLTARVHPKMQVSDNVVDNLNHMLNHVPRLVLLYPDRDHELMCVCNFMTKIPDPSRLSDHPYHGPMVYINKNDIYDNYPISPEIDICDIPAWIMREHMSFNLFSSWQDRADWYLLDHWQHPRCLAITTKELFDNFDQTLDRILKFWQQTPVRSLSELKPWHEEMLRIQPHRGKDKLCKNIIDSVLDQAEHFEWEDLCMVSQSWIQYKLRQNGYEIQCNNLDHFPTDTDNLKSIMFKSAS